MWGGQMIEMRRNFQIEWIRDTINRKWTRMFVPPYCIINSLTNVEQAVMLNQEIRLLPLCSRLIGLGYRLSLLIGRC